MIADARAFQPETVPEELHHREGHIDALTRAFQPIADGVSGEDVFLSGPSGAGKTTTVKFVLSRLERETFNVRWGYANCISTSSAPTAMNALLRDLGYAADLRPEGTPAAAYYDRLRDLDHQFVAVLDEVDVLRDRGLLASLYEIPHVTLAMITIDEDEFFADLDARIRSRIHGAVKVRLERYSHEEMRDILRGRVEVGLRGDPVADEVVSRLADLANGDARLGIALLRQAVRRTLGGDATELTLADLDAELEDAARAAVRDRHVATLSTHQRHLYEIVRSRGPISGSELRAAYERRASEPRSDARRRQLLDSLERYGLIQTEGTGRGKTYARGSY